MGATVSPEGGPLADARSMGVDFTGARERVACVSHRFEYRPQAGSCERQPPAIEPTIMNGSSPLATRSGSGVSSGSCDKSCSQA